MDPDEGPARMLSGTSVASGGGAGPWELGGGGGYAAELLADPGRCLEQLMHAKLAAAPCGVPAPGGAFPAWEWRGAVRPSGGEETLRAVGRARWARSGEAPYAAVVEVAFRGSRNMENWLSNLDARLAASELGARHGRVHRGFQAAYLALRPGVLAMVEDSLLTLGVHAGARVLALVTGHSLGGALATFAAYDLSSLGRYSARCATWGSPRVGDADFAASYAARVPLSARFVNKFDVTPGIPFNPADEQDDDSGAVLPRPVKSLLHAVLWKPQERLGIGGPRYQHVCRSTVLNPGADSEAYLRTCGTAALQGQGSKAFLQFHRIGAYGESLARLWGVGAAARAGNSAGEQQAAPN
mmetsp:Transcript_59328/g.167113  ORF Transcript_59328/g.167113 Transcript_59328/m.167113 type:complete len:355 (+) Transcript_59328:127-1191(+)